MTGERVGRISGDTHIKVLHTRARYQCGYGYLGGGVRQNADIAREAGLSIGSQEELN